jgi:hypothetical protein
MVKMDEDTIKIYMPKFLLRWAHRFRVNLNPIYSDENYDTDIVIKLPLPKLLKVMEAWGCELNHPNQFEYPGQVASGHLYLNNGKQFHMRVTKNSKGLLLKGHVEWHGITHPILHIMYANLDYEKGYQMLKRLLDKSGVEIIIDKGKGKYDKESLAKAKSKSKSKPEKKGKKK